MLVFLNGPGNSLNEKCQFFLRVCRFCFLLVGSDVVIFSLLNCVAFSFIIASDPLVYLPLTFLMRSIMIFLLLLLKAAEALCWFAKFIGQKSHICVAFIR